MGDIAQSAGITAPALYWHFKSKEDICLLFLKRLAESLLAAIDRNVRSTQPHQQLVEFVQAHVLLQYDGSEDAPLAETPFSYGQFRMKLSPERRADLDRLHDELTGRLRDILIRGVEARSFVVRDLVASTYAILGLGEFVSAWYRPDGRLSPTELSSIYSQFALRMAGYAPALDASMGLPAASQT